MKSEIMNAVFAPSEDVVVREIEEEMIIVPIVSGIGDMEDALFTLNETGQAIWKKLDGEKTVREIVKLLQEEFKAKEGEIEKDVIGFLEELHKRGIVVRRKR